MRTTLTIDDDILRAAKALAHARSQSLGEVVSELIRKGLQSERRIEKESGFPVFAVSARARPITLEDVRRGEDEG